MHRRDFLSLLALLGGKTLTGCAPHPPEPISSRWRGVSAAIAHRLRDPAHLPPITQTERLPVLIVGGGIAGLSAGRRLAQSGFKDFRILELESHAGGNSRSEANEVSEYPLGAHYLPLATPESKAVRSLLAELGVIIGDPQATHVEYDERYLCASPQERVYRHRYWQDGLRPQLGLSKQDAVQYQRFYEIIQHFRAKEENTPNAFTIPMAYSRQDPSMLALDRLSFHDWLLSHQLDSPNLHWYINYACRDDYGTDSTAVSAWAGIHYFAARSGQAKWADDHAVLTHPSGNGWLVRGIIQSMCDHLHTRHAPIETNAFVYHVQRTPEAVHVDVWFPDHEKSTRFIVQELIWAAPLHLIPSVMPEETAWVNAARAFSHAPWLVANLTLKTFPNEHAGAPLSWDNVLFDSPSVGYVVATHQTLRMTHPGTVFTYYWPLSHQAPALSRMALLDKPTRFWVDAILDDLSAPYPELRSLSPHLDLVAHAHAMSRPTPGLIFGDARRLFAQDAPRVRFAHADVSGFSLFEEAQYRGILAAERTLIHLKHAFEPSL